MNIAFSDLFGKKLALLLWYNDENDEPAAAVISGTAFFHKGFLTLHRGHIAPPLPVPLPLVWRAKAVPQTLRDIVQNAEFCIQATISEMGWKQPARDHLS